MPTNFVKFNDLVKTNRCNILTEIGVEQKKKSEPMLAVNTKGCGRAVLI